MVIKVNGVTLGQKGPLWIKDSLRGFRKYPQEITKVRREEQEYICWEELEDKCPDRHVSREAFASKNRTTNIEKITLPSRHQFQKGLV